MAAFLLKTHRLVLLLAAVYQADEFLVTDIQPAGRSLESGAFHPF